MVKKKVIGCLGGAGLVLLILGSTVLGIFPSMMKNMLAKQFVIKEGTEIFELWKDIPLPIFLRAYMWNVTNPDDVMYKGSKPILREVGPYTFRQTRKKHVLGFEQNGEIVRYREKKGFYFLPELSIGDQSEKVYVVNPISAAIVWFAKKEFTGDMGKYVMQDLNNILKEYGEKLLVHRTVDELLFKGYKVEMFQKLREMADMMGMEPAPTPPDDIFGLLRPKNGSDDGEMRAFTGVGDVSRFGIYVSWNNRTYLPWWPHKTCNQINGTDGGLFPPYLTKDRVLYGFAPDVCRSMFLKYDSDSDVYGIPAYRYRINKELFGGPLVYPDNWCFCDEDDCLTDGVFGMMACAHGAPIFLSWPHFYMAHPKYLKGVEGLRPERVLHETIADLEPTTSMTMNATRRLQINVGIRNSENVDTFDKIQDYLVFPLVWVQENAAIDQAFADDFKFKFFTMVSIAKGLMTALVVLGTFGIVSSISLGVHKYHKNKRCVSTQHLYPMTPDGTKTVKVWN